MRDADFRYFSKPRFKAETIHKGKWDYSSGGYFQRRVTFGCLLLPSGNHSIVRENIEGIIGDDWAMSNRGRQLAR